MRIRISERKEKGGKKKGGGKEGYRGKKKGKII
jgi:hypothetical protein